MTDTILLPQKIRDKQLWGQLYGSSLSLILAEYCQASFGIKLLIAPDNLSAQELYQDLQFFLGEQRDEYSLLFFPDWETLPYDTFSPHQDLISQRLYTLSQLQHNHDATIVTSINTLMHRIAPPSFMNQYAFSLKKGQKFHLEQCRQQLQQSGYHCVDNVFEHGEFAVRGSIIDLYPMGSNNPFRIELFDNTIESLRYFDAESQRTIKKIDHINVLPARECPLNDNSIALFRSTFRETFSGNPSACPIYEAVSRGQYPNGLEYYLPLFFEQMATLFDYLPSNASICHLQAIRPHADAFWEEINTRFEQHRYNVTRPILSPETTFIPPNELLERITNYQTIRLEHEPLNNATVNFRTEKTPSLHASRQSTTPLKLLADHIENSPKRHLLIAESAGRREVLIDLLKVHNIVPAPQSSWNDFLQSNLPLNITVSSLSQGMECTDANISVIVESQLFGEHRAPQQQRRNQKTIDPDLIIRHLAELQVGAPVVHLQFGVGRYEGLQTLEHNNRADEFLILTYAGGDKIYVPVTSLNLISRYTGTDPDQAPLHRLGSDQWQKEKKKAALKIHDIATELLELYAKRKAKPGHTYELHTNDYQRFANAFPFDETKDQQQAIADIMQDMQSNKPMDRLICGDVGFGKTEVAMRAAFIAVANGKQVCILTPTTLLAKQHFETFQDRFANYPVNIELLSRFRTEKESKNAIQSLQAGRTDIIIGTHKLLQKQVGFHALGLLIIDEEHRFGVQQKERLKALRAEVDVLSMTATPIPRTLNMAMAGIRDISLIATPPAKRLAIRTFWQEKNDALLREAMLREILRGGQVFFLHNRVQTIEQTAEHIRSLIPEAVVRVAHGQMRERELEQIMADFYHHRFNVLVCTTIIETGIDIPTANTIVIDRADKFGLAQLHQLRGRVGRSHHQAYAYLLTPHKKILTPDAIKRLEAIVSLEELGSGFILATHDLEIRGAGELLGGEQSGNIHAIGFTLFMEMLDNTIRDIKLGKTPSLDLQPPESPEINVDFSTIIPSDYIPDTHTRLIIYKRIAGAEDKAGLHALQVEMVDRFGLMPPSVKLLILLTEAKSLATKLGITHIHIHGQKGQLEFNQAPKIKPDMIIKLIQGQPSKYQLKGPNRLMVALKSTEPHERVDELMKLMHNLKTIVE